MIDNLLDFTQSRISGGIQITPNQGDLCEVSKQVLEELRSSNPGRDIRHEIKGDCTGQWDTARIDQIYQNLISNALQYGDPGTAVTVTSEGNPDEVVIRVHNDGNPIPEQQQERLFDLFQRLAHSGEENPRTNLGLGLYIVREIVSAHCGAITVESGETTGTDFTVRLPKDRAAACPSPPSHKLRVVRATSFNFRDNSPDHKLH